MYSGQPAGRQAFSFKMQNFILKDKIFWLLLVFASIYILGNIGTGSLSTWDEALYANVAREALGTGNWLVLHYRGEGWFDKPPLYIWMTACFYKAFGVNEFTTRLTSGLFGIATILLTYIFAKRVSNRNTAIFASLILLATPHFLHFSKLGMMDVPTAFFIFLMIYLFWRGQEEPQYLFFSGAVLGIAYLMKGFAVFLGPIIIFVYCVFSGQWRNLFKCHFIAGILLAFVIIAGWHFSQYYLTGPEAIKGYFGFHIYERATRAVQGHTGGINFYQKAIFNKNKPWSIIAYLSCFYILWQAIRYRLKKAILICCWIAVAYVLYTAVKTKLHWYIMLIYPALALSSGIFLERFLKGKIFKLSLVIILIGMLLQVPISWAFKLDFTHDVKKVGDYARELHDRGEDVYITELTYSEVFYCSFAKPLEIDLYHTIINEGKRNAYCIILPEYLKETSIKYNFSYQPVYESDRLSLYRIRFK